MLTHSLDLLKGGWRYATGLRDFLSKTITLEEAKAIVTHQLRDREENFLWSWSGASTDNCTAPITDSYSTLALSSTMSRPWSVTRASRERYQQLHDAGVYVTLDEFKGRAPIRRPGLEFSVSDRDFDNPLLTSHYTASTSGSRGGGGHAST